MRITALFFLFFALGACQSSPQVEQKTEGEEPYRVSQVVYHNMLGNPQIRYRYEYNENGNLIRETITDSSAQGWTKRQKLYQYKDDKLVNLKMFYPDGNLEYQYNMEFDKRGNKVVEEAINENNQVTRRVEFDHDKNGNVTKEVVVIGPDKQQLTYKYAKGNRLKEARKYDMNNRLVLKNVYKYEDDRLSELNYYDGTGQKLTSWVYDYDHNGNLVAEKETRPDGSFYVLKTYGFDANSQKQVEQAYRYQKYRIVFFYDEDGILTKERYYNQENLLEKTTYYEIKP